MKKIIFLSVLFFTLLACNKNANLQWSEKAPNYMNWYDAVEYCQNLNEGGHNDWKLPTISELRSLIQNCPATQTGGKCKVADNCLSDKECDSDACNGCGYYSGDKYSKLGDDTSFWSSSVPEYPSYAWRVYFYDASVSERNAGSNDGVRCVRDQK